jgi:hypothetical protein
VSKREKTNLTRKVTVRFKPEEYNKVSLSLKATTKKKLSEYIRYVLLEKPVTVYTRDQSVDDLMAELVRLRNELSAIGSNFNQLVKRLHTANQFSEFKELALASEKQNKKFIETAAEINLKISELSGKRWQE